MKRLKPCVFLVIFFLSCAKTVPENLIPEDKMISVLTDVHLASGTTSANGDSVIQTISTYLNMVYRKHNIDTALFRESLQYYSKDPTLLANMYEKIVKDLEVKVKELTKLEEIEKRQLDLEQQRLNELKQDSSISLLKPMVPIIWSNFKAYKYVVKKDTNKSSVQKK
ncbi:MAG TPA: DUF4296 domain-containing protein [Sphingobacteriaceae bacterium]|nr:DUF4296 domain-containing protein [Sphingobacteriaceae bacterium]